MSLFAGATGYCVNSSIDLKFLTEYFPVRKCQFVQREIFHENVLITMTFLFQTEIKKKHIDWVKMSPILDIFGMEHADVFFQTILPVEEFMYYWIYFSLN